MNNNDIVQKLWNLCDVLRDDGINYSDYVTELVLLLFIKMEYENTEAGLLDKHKLPEGCRWPDLNSKNGTTTGGKLTALATVYNTAAGAESYQLDYHCLDAYGQHTGTSEAITVLQNQ